MEEKTNKITIVNRTIVYPEKEEELKELAKSYTNLVVTRKTLKEAKNARKNLRDERYNIQNIQKQNNILLSQYVKEYKSQNDKIASSLINIIRPTENIIDEQIKAIELKIEEEKKEAERIKKEKLRMQADKAQSILNYFDKILNAKTAKDIIEILEPLTKDNCLESDYGAYTLIAKQNKEKVILQANKLIEIFKEKERENKLKIEEELKKAEKELQEARGNYFTYFHKKPPINYTVQQLKEAIFTDIKDKEKTNSEEEKNEIPLKKVETEKKLVEKPQTFPKTSDETTLSEINIEKYKGEITKLCKDMIIELSNVNNKEELKKLILKKITHLQLINSDLS